MAGEFQKGRTKTGGRTLGTVNKNANLKDKIRDYLLEKFEIYTTTLDMLAVEDQGAYVREYREMIKYVVPAISPVPYDNESKITTAQEHLRKMTGYDSPKDEGDNTTAGQPHTRRRTGQKKSIKETLTNITDERDKTDKSE